jgi:hypothetical protein
MLCVRLRIAQAELDDAAAAEIEDALASLASDLGDVAVPERASSSR